MTISWIKNYRSTFNVIRAIDDLIKKNVIDYNMLMYVKELDVQYEAPNGIWYQPLQPVFVTDDVLLANKLSGMRFAVERFSRGKKIKYTTFGEYRRSHKRGKRAPAAQLELISLETEDPTTDIVVGSIVQTVIDSIEKNDSRTISINGTVAYTKSVVDRLRSVIRVRGKLGKENEKPARLYSRA